LRRTIGNKGWAGGRARLALHSPTRACGQPRRDRCFARTIAFLFARECNGRDAVREGGARRRSNASCEQIQDLSEQIRRGLIRGSACSELRSEPGVPANVLAKMLKGTAGHFQRCGAPTRACGNGPNATREMLNSFARRIHGVDNRK
jgi:hypothetical protein